MSPAFGRNFWNRTYFFFEYLIKFIDFLYKMYIPDTSKI